MALCFYYHQNENKINYILNQLKERYEFLKTKKSISLKSEIDNVYEYLADLRNESASAEERQKVRRAEVIIKNENVLFEKVLEMRQNSKPITMKKFAHALKFNQMKKGKTEEQAEGFAKKALKNTTKRAATRFDDEATNTFKKKAMQIASVKGDN